MKKTNYLAFIIDDDHDDQSLLTETLQEIDETIEFFYANNGQEGLRKLETDFIPIPSIIFLDLNMPRINGQQLLLSLKKNPKLRDIPVIVYTTSSYQKDIDEMMLFGATDYLVKQSEQTALKEELKTIMSRVLPG